ncbi:hypothetical protein ABZ403_14015 [Micromonospora zamorensis]|uniref:hypothetical protein n=1 Tax=Micromonospora zamorensis TaxID=709883 RepID=UPI0033E95046
MTRNEEAAKVAARRRRRLMLGIPEEPEGSGAGTTQERAEEPGGVPALNEALKALSDELFCPAKARRRLMLGFTEENN